MKKKTNIFIVLLVIGMALLIKNEFDYASMSYKIKVTRDLDEKEKKILLKEFMISPSDSISVIGASCSVCRDGELRLCITGIKNIEEFVESYFPDIQKVVITPIDNFKRYYSLVNDFEVFKGTYYKGQVKDRKINIVAYHYNDRLYIEFGKESFDLRTIKSIFFK